MTARVDGVRLLKVFTWCEAVLVVIPLALYGLVYAGLILAMLLAPETVGTLMVVPFCLVLFAGSFYLLLPGLIAPSLIRATSPLPVLLPEGLAGWLVVIAVYSALAALPALWASLYSVDRTHWV